MAEIVTPAAPAAPAAPAPSAASLPSSAAPRPEIKVSSLPAPAEPAKPPKKGSVREDVFKNLRDRARPDPGATPDPEPTPAAAPDKLKPAEPGDKEQASAAPDDPKKPKINPWKLVDEHKAKRAELEAKLLELEKRAIPENKWKETQDNLTAKEKRLAELEEEIRYVNYSKSDEFKTKYQAPYEKAWGRAMAELGELTVETGDGNVRGLAAQDILELVNLPLGKAHELATEKFGDLAPEVMAHRKEIRKLFDDQAAALEDARKSGAEREKTTKEKYEREYGEVSNSIKQTWTQSNEEVAADKKYGVYFTPVEGDEQGNQRLAKGFELADRAFSENPLAPGLTAEQRNSIVQRHAAVRNRAAAFGRLVYQNNQAKDRIAELEKIVAEYKGSEPDLKGGTPPPVKPAKTNGMAGVLEELRKKAK